MKKLLLIFCAVLLVSVMLCGCGDEKAENAAEKVGDQVETIASEVKDNVDNMIEDGTVRDGDGYIGDTDRATEAPYESDTRATEDMTENDDVFDTDPSDNDTNDTGDNL